MNCNNCGKQIDDNAAFCNNCGAKLTIDTNGNQESGKKIRKTPILIVGLIGSLVLIITTVLLLISSGKVKNFAGFIEHQDYQSAKQLYRNLSDSNREKANKWMEKYVESIQIDYEEEKLDYQSARKELADLSSYQAIKGIIADALAHMDATQFERQFESEEVDIALRLYQTMSDNARNEANDWLITYLQTIESNYYNGTVDYRTAHDKISNLCEIDATYNDAAATLERLYADNEAATAYTNAKESAEQGKWITAFQLLESIDPEYRAYDEVSKTRTEFITTYRETVLAGCEELLSEEKYADIFSTFSEAFICLPDDTELTAKYNEYINTFESISLDKAANLAESEKYTDAIESLEGAQEIRYYDSFRDAAAEYYYLWLVKTAETTEDEYGLESAVAVLDSERYNSSYFNDKCLSFAETYFTRFVNDVLDRAGNYAKDRKFQKAIEVLQDALYTYSCDDLYSAIDNYSAYLPIDLADCQVIDSKRLKVGSFTDAFGYTYENAIANEKSGAYAHVIYYLNNRFVKLSGTISVITCELNYNDQPVGHPIYFYKDGELVYTTPTIINNTEPFSFEIDVSGCSQLEIYFSEEEYYWWDWQAVISASLS